MLAELNMETLGLIIVGTIASASLITTMVGIVVRHFNKSDERRARRKQEAKTIKADMEEFIIAQKSDLQEKLNAIDRREEKERARVIKEEKEEKEREELKKLFPQPWLSAYEKCKRINNSNMRVVWLNEWIIRYKPPAQLSLIALEKFARMIDGYLGKEILEKFSPFLDLGPKFVEPENPTIQNHADDLVATFTHTHIWQDQWTSSGGVWIRRCKCGRVEKYVSNGKWLQMISPNDTHTHIWMSRRDGMTRECNCGRVEKFRTQPDGGGKWICKEPPATVTKRKRKSTTPGTCEKCGKNHRWTRYTLLTECLALIKRSQSYGDTVKDIEQMIEEEKIGTLEVRLYKEKFDEIPTELTQIKCSHRWKYFFGDKIRVCVKCQFSQTKAEAELAASSNSPYQPKAFNRLSLTETKLGD